MTDMPTTYDTHQTTMTSHGPARISPRPEYLKTIPGILKIVEIILDLVVFICAIIVWGGGGGVWVRFVSMSAFITTLIYLILHFMNVIQTFGQINLLILLDILVFICSVMKNWEGEGWLGFVSMSAFLTTLVLFILYLLGVIARIPGWFLLVILDLIIIVCSSIARWDAAQAYVQFVCITSFLVTLLLLILHVLSLISRFPGPWLLIELIYYVVFSVFYLIAAIVAAAFAKYHSSIGAAAFFAFAATAVYAVDTFFQFRAYRTGQTEMTTSGTATTTTTVHTTHTAHTVEAKATY